MGQLGHEYVLTDKPDILGLGNGSYRAQTAHDTENCLMNASIDSYNQSQHKPNKYSICLQW